MVVSRKMETKSFEQYIISNMYLYLLREWLAKSINIAAVLMAHDGMDICLVNAVKVV